MTALPPTCVMGLCVPEPWSFLIAFALLSFAVSTLLVMVLFFRVMLDEAMFRRRRKARGNEVDLTFVQRYGGEKF